MVYYLVRGEWDGVIVFTTATALSLLTCRLAQSQKIKLAKRILIFSINGIVFLLAVNSPLESGMIYSFLTVIIAGAYLFADDPYPHLLIVILSPLFLAILASLPFVEAILIVPSVNNYLQGTPHLVILVANFTCVPVVVYFFIQLFHKRRFKLYDAREQLVDQQNELIEQFRENVKEYAKMLSHKNEIIQSLDHRLNNGYNGECPDYDLVAGLLKSTLHTNAEWIEFKAKFTRIHPSFLQKLRGNYDDLTDAGERLLVLTKLKLNTREIASMLGVSVESVHKSRYRLRKKLGINHLDEFVSGI